MNEMIVKLSNGEYGLINTENNELIYTGTYDQCELLKG